MWATCCVGEYELVVVEAVVVGYLLSMGLRLLSKNRDLGTMHAVSQEKHKTCSNRCATTNHPDGTDGLHAMHWRLAGAGQGRANKKKRVRRALVVSYLATVLYHYDIVEHY